ncbi:MAG: serine/threonine-protein kinase RsbW [Solirubrobacteraceae bacterium]|jgi:anti-sigma regulatory factor (Ser/Thr protein kinase)|nr:serine/threonine-protein kinase RsbW [Solirubrobacteraceae bacterium]
MALTDSGRGLNASYPAHAAQVPLIRRAVDGIARSRGADDETLTRIGLAVTEAATNVVLHAYRGPQENERIHVRARVADQCLAVTVRDNGIGMGPRPDSPGLGLGLALMAHEAERCEIRAALGGGTEVLLRFALGDRAAGEPWRHNGFGAAGAGAAVA